mmetsp:Transcript_129999/g.308429  ORF Transcript_129999/g.308429 Transcript_129999/m.308429 type:complete len:239 (-) Transcript_129999:1508-2224(-)
MGESSQSWFCSTLSGRSAAIFLSDLSRLITKGCMSRCSKRCFSATSGTGSCFLAAAARGFANSLVNSLLEFARYPGRMNSKQEWRSAREFSTGVPLKATRTVPQQSAISLTSLATWVPWFLMFWASSKIMPANCCSFIRFFAEVRKVPYEVSIMCALCSSGSALARFPLLAAFGAALAAPAAAPAAPIPPSGFGAPQLLQASRTVLFTSSQRGQIQLAACAAGRPVGRALASSFLELP